MINIQNDVPIDLRVDEGQLACDLLDWLQDKGVREPDVVRSVLVKVLSGINVQFSDSHSELIDTSLRTVRMLALCTANAITSSAELDNEEKKS